MDDKEKHTQIPINVWGIANIGCSMENVTFQTLVAAPEGTTSEEAEVVEEVRNEKGSDVRLNASRQEILEQLLALADKGGWINGVTAEAIKMMLQQVLQKSETMWLLLEKGRGDRVKIVWQNLIGYFVDRKLLPSTIGAPALNKMFFGDDKGYTNIDKGRPSKNWMTADFESLVPLLDAYVPKVDKKA